MEVASDNGPTGNPSEEDHSVNTGVNGNGVTIKSSMPRRVKVYLLQGDDWLDNGTGYCMGEYDKESQKPYFIVRNELDADDVILRSYLEGNIQYQRQQETLIVWSDASGKDLALSFQENEGCADLCEFIIRVQQENISPMISLYYVLTTLPDSPGDGPQEITELVTGPINYPPKTPTRDCLEDLLEVVSQGSNSRYTRGMVSSFIVNSGYFAKLFELFQELEVKHDLKGLHLLCEVIKVLLTYSETSLLENLVSSESQIMGLVGVLEYDNEYPDFKACYREFLQDETNFKTVIDLPLPSDESGMNTFRKGFILTYLKNVVLPRVSDDSFLNILSSMVFNNQVESIRYLQDSQANDNFLARLFDLYEDDDCSIETKRDGVRMLHQYVVIANGQSIHSKPEFFGALLKADFSKMVRFALSDSDRSIRVLGTEILVTVIDQDVNTFTALSTEDQFVDEVDKVSSNNDVPNHIPQEDASETAANVNIMKQKILKDMSLTMSLANVLLKDEDPGLKIQAFEALKTLLCFAVYQPKPLPDSEDNAFSKSPRQSAPKEEEKLVHDYIWLFYKTIAPNLFKTFIELGGGDEAEKELATQELKKDFFLHQHLCELLTFCSREHGAQYSVPFVTENNVIRGLTLVLKMPVNTTLKLSVIRYIKGLISLDDTTLCRHIINGDLLRPFFEFFDTVAEENSLINSSCLDLLEIIIRKGPSKNLDALAVYIYKTQKTLLESKITYVSTGRDLMQIAEACIEANRDATATSVDLEPDNNYIESSPEYQSQDEESSNNYSTSHSKRNIFETLDAVQNRSKRPRDESIETQ